MNEKKCTHESIYINNDGNDMVGVCDKCGKEIFISHIKNGLYVINYDEKIYLLNTIDDMDLDANPYQFLINGNTICIHKYINEDYKNGSARQLCKNKVKHL